MAESRRRPKGYYEWRPRSETRVLLGQVAEILEEYEEYLPLTVRQVFYRLVGRFEYEKTEAGYRKLSEKITLARRARLIPFDSIRDDGVVTTGQRWHDGIEGFWDEVGSRARHYSRDRQVGQSVRMELWTESAGMMPQLDTVASVFSIPVYSAGGQPSVTANEQVARRVLEKNVPTVLLHLGDFDPSGESIFRSMSEDIRAFVRADRVIHTLDLIPVRVALTAEQVEDYNLPTTPPKKSDSRSKDWQGGTCQLEALAPDDLAAILQDAILEWLDVDTWKAQVETEQGEREQLLRSLPSGDS